MSERIWEDEAPLRALAEAYDRELPKVLRGSRQRRCVSGKQGNNVLIKDTRSLPAHVVEEGDALGRLGRGAVVASTVVGTVATARGDSRRGRGGRGCRRARRGCYSSCCSDPGRGGRGGSGNSDWDGSGCGARILIDPGHSLAVHGCRDPGTDLALLLLVDSGGLLCHIASIVRVEGGVIGVVLVLVRTLSLQL